MEIERKFFIKELPDAILKNCDRAEIEQGYLDYGSEEIPERRIRKISQNGSAEYFYTEKSSGDLCREEEEYEISEYSYKKLKELIISPIIEKTRYYLYSDGFLIEIDVYGEALMGLTVAEIEFASLEESKKFTVPEWFGEEITHDKKYKNKNLAKLI